MEAKDKYFNLKAGRYRFRISLMCAAAFLYFTHYSFMSFSRTFHIPTALVGGGILVLFAGSLFCFTWGTRRVSLDGILLIAYAALFFIVTMAVHPEYQYRFDDIYYNGRFGVKAVFSYGAGIYTYYLIRLFNRSEKKLYSMFRVIAFIILFFDVWVIFFNRSEEYQMGFGYQMEMAAILFMIQYLEEKKSRIYFVLSFATILAGVLYGSRACILGYAAFIAVYFLWKGHLDKKQKFLIFLGVAAAVCYSSNTIMRFIYRFFESLGFHSRTLYYIAMGDVLAVDQARQKYIWPPLIEALKKMPWYSMYGAYGDRYFLTSRWPHSHNIVLEILLTFGIPLGVLFFLWIFVEFVKVIRHNKDRLGVLTIAFGCYALCKLAFSNTFWQETYFWTFLAMLVNCREKREAAARRRIYVHMPEAVRSRKGRPPLQGSQIYVHMPEAAQVRNNRTRLQSGQICMRRRGSGADPE